MIIVFSEHALKRMGEREISRAFVEDTIANSDRSIRQDNEQFMAVKQFGNRAILAVCTRTNDIVFVLTVISTSKISKYLK